MDEYYSMLAGRSRMTHLVARPLVANVGATASWVIDVMQTSRWSPTHGHREKVCLKILDGVQRDAGGGGTSITGVVHRFHELTLSL